MTVVARPTPPGWRQDSAERLDNWAGVTRPNFSAYASRKIGLVPRLIGCSGVGNAGAPGASAPVIFYWSGVEDHHVHARQRGSCVV